MRRLRVGGTYWASCPAIPPNQIIVRSSRALTPARRLFGSDRLVLWSLSRTAEVSADVKCIDGDCDPWHMLSEAAAVVAAPDDEVRAIASLMGVPCFLLDSATGELDRESMDVTDILAQFLPPTAYENPFTSELMTLVQTIELCGFWRKLIDSNRDLAGGLGFAFWKQDHVAPLLWNGTAPFRFLRDAADVRAGASVAIWRAKASAAAIEELAGRNVSFVEVEDGFVRSKGLGADCIPPLSITADRSGAYFDPGRPSELEQLLQEGKLDDDELLERACKLRQFIVEAGIAKYESGTRALERPAGSRRHLLVVGQVEDDRAVIMGGCGLVRNIDLLERVRIQAPDAFILYKPHPDVLAGHRRGSVPERDCLRYADQIVGEVQIASLIEMVDEVHVNTSLAGFEALLRNKPVTTYGVPFYAGWGLTTDLGPVPKRRSAGRTLDELVAAALLLYPRYLDPVSGLPCPAEVLVMRLGAEEMQDPGMFVGLRRLQGKLMRCLRSLVQ